MSKTKTYEKTLKIKPPLMCSRQGTKLSHTPNLIQNGNQKISALLQTNLESLDVNG